MVGGRPLDLRLAAELLRREHLHQPAEGHPPDLALFARIGEIIADGKLRRRFLDHVHDPLVRQLLHPGLLLRRITPELILQILKPVGKRPIRTIEDAKGLFDKLGGETSLVEC
jgi:hypothetical protein